MRETRPAISASSWRERIAHTCRADDGTFEGVPADLEGSCYLWWPVVKLAHGMGERFASPVWRRPAIELIANAAWADRATTEQWLAELREEEGTRAAARSASEPRAARAVREQQALDAWIAKTQARLLDPVWFTGLTPEVEADIRAQFRDWIARRLRELASEVRRGIDDAEGR
jgi:hypothetical protein